MADYNVQMKQYNGTSFDNILPHAYLADVATNAEKLGGGGRTEIIAQARAGLSQIATGSYVGNGVYTQPTQINVGFNPRLIFISQQGKEAPKQYTAINGVKKSWRSVDTILARADIKYGPYPSGSFPFSETTLFSGIYLIDDFPVVVVRVAGSSFVEFIALEVTKSSGIIRISQKWYYSSDGEIGTLTNDIRDASYQFNTQGVTYYYTAIA